MKAILIFVSTLDGKITKWGDPKIRSWSSNDDQEHFDTIWNETRVIIMGTGTYKPDPIKADPMHLFIVMTRHLSNYEGLQVPGLLEFTNDSPENLLQRFEHSEEKVLIVGGPQIATSFLQKQLIDELWLTIEPKIFGIGGNFVINEKLNIELELLSFIRVNSRGTLITKYKVLKV